MLTSKVVSLPTFEHPPHCSASSIFLFFFTNNKHSTIRTRWTNTVGARQDGLLFVAWQMPTPKKALTKRVNMYLPTQNTEISCETYRFQKPWVSRPIINHKSQTSITNSNTWENTDPTENNPGKEPHEPLLKKDTNNKSELFKTQQHMTPQSSNRTPRLISRCAVVQKRSRIKNIQNMSTQRPTPMRIEFHRPWAPTLLPTFSPARLGRRPPVPAPAPRPP